MNEESLEDTPLGKRFALQNEADLKIKKGFLEAQEIVGPDSALAIFLMESHYLFLKFINMIEDGKEKIE